MKKIIITLMLVLLVATSLVGCGNKKNSGDDTNKNDTSQTQSDKNATADNNENNTTDSSNSDNNASENSNNNSDNQNTNSEDATEYEIQTESPLEHSGEEVEVDINEFI